VSTVVHAPTCRALVSLPGRGVRCTCGADPDDPADPEGCEVCGAVFGIELGIWSYRTVIDQPVRGRKHVITCQSPSCIRRAGMMRALCRQRAQPEPADPMTALDRVFALTAEVLSNAAAGRPSGRVLLERDRLLWSLSEDDRRLYFAWAEQELPS
jgi:hypothetical protein